MAGPNQQHQDGGPLRPADDMLAWLQARVREQGGVVTGEIAVVRERRWARVFRVPTDRGDCYFKASAPAMRHEPAATALLAGIRPDLIPAPLAIEPERGWMLLADAGAQLGRVVQWTGEMEAWLRVLSLYAELQVQAAGRVGELLALGVPDLRLPGLTARFERLLDHLEAGLRPDGPAERTSQMAKLRASVPGVRRAAHRLAGAGIPETIQHDDLNDGAVYLGPGGPQILDWGDACISHPFFTMSVTLEGVIAWGPDDVRGSVATDAFRDAYLASFRGLAEEAALREAFDLALRLGWAGRAVNGHGLDPDPEAAWARLGMFLEAELPEAE